MLSKSEGIIKDGIIRYTEAISQALNEEDPKAATQAFINFGAFLQEQYPGMGLDDVRKKIIRSEIGLPEQELPDLQLFGNLSEGRIRAYEDVVRAEPTDKNAIYRMDALQKGLNIFSVVLGEERHQEALSKIAEVEESDIDEAQKLIMGSKYEISPIVTEAERMDFIAKAAVQDLRTVIDRTLQQLTQQMEEEANKTSNAPLAEPSTKFKLAQSSYKALEELQKTVNEAGTAKERLERFQTKLNEEPIKNALSSNPDDAVTKFLKLASYVLKTIFSASIYHWVEEGKPLRSVQQQALKEAITTLKDAEKEGVISDTPKNNM